MDDDEAIKLVLTLHTNSKKLQKDVITRNLDLKGALDLAELMEMAEREVKFMNNPGPLQNSKAPETDPSLFKEVEEVQRTRRKAECWWCGGSFPHQNGCPARNAVCKKCTKKGHYTRKCPKDNSSRGNMQWRRKPQSQDTNQVRIEEEEYEYGIETLHIDHTTMIQKEASDQGPEPKPELNTNVRIKINNQYVTMQVDQARKQM